MNEIVDLRDKIIISLLPLCISAKCMQVRNQGYTLLKAFLRLWSDVHSWNQSIFCFKLKKFRLQYPNVLSPNFPSHSTFTVSDPTLGFSSNICLPTGSFLEFQLICKIYSILSRMFIRTWYEVKSPSSETKSPLNVNN